MNDIRRDISGPVISVILWVKKCCVAPSRPEDGAGGVVYGRVGPLLKLGIINWNVLVSRQD